MDTETINFNWIIMCDYFSWTEVPLATNVKTGTSRHRFHENYKSGTKNQPSATVFWNSKLDKDVAANHQYIEGYVKAKREKERREGRKKNQSYTTNKITYPSAAHSIKRPVEKGEQPPHELPPESLMSKSGARNNKMKMLKISTTSSGHRIVQFEDGEILQNTHDPSVNARINKREQHSATGTIPKNKKFVEAPVTNFSKRGKFPCLV